MKKYFLLSILTMTTLFFTSCDEELQVQDLSQIPVDQFITDDASAETALLHGYHNMQSTNIAGPVQKMFSGIYSDNFDHTGSFPTYLEARLNNIQPDNVTITSYFASNFILINTATAIIRTIEGLDADALSTGVRSNTLAEAHAMRAYAYFQLVKLWGGVPIDEETVSLDGFPANHTPRSTEAAVYTYIESEIAAAEGNITNTNKLRFTADALQVLKAKVMLYQGKYPEAESALEPLIGKYSLAPNYADLYVVGGDTAESIFRIDYSPSDPNSLAFFYYPSPQGRREVAPSADFLAAFDANDDRINMIENNTDFSTAYLNKYSDNANGTDIPYIYRYADVLLMYAEVLARRDAADASDYINEVRTRAGLADVAINSGNVVTLIANERRFEFYGEGDRWDDVKRLGLAQQVIESKGLTFNPNRVLWPIPQAEIDANDELSQADQNPGY